VKSPVVVVVVNTDVPVAAHASPVLTLVTVMFKIVVLIFTGFGGTTVRGTVTATVPETVNEPQPAGGGH